MRTIFNLFVVWGLTGLWHGASWNFVLWGLYFFVLLFLEKFFIGGGLKKIPPLGLVYTLLAVFVGWVLFRYTDLHAVGAVLRGLTGVTGNPLTSFEVTTLWQNHYIILLVSVFCSTPVLKLAGERLEKLAKRRPLTNRLFGFFAYGLVPIALLLLSTASLVGSTYNPFMYFQF